MKDYAEEYIKCHFDIMDRVDWDDHYAVQVNAAYVHYDYIAELSKLENFKGIRCANGNLVFEFVK